MQFGAHAEQAEQVRQGQAVFCVHKRPVFFWGFDTLIKYHLCGEYQIDIHENNLIYTTNTALCFLITIILTYILNIIYGVIILHVKDDTAPR